MRREVERNVNSLALRVSDEAPTVEVLSAIVIWRRCTLDTSLILWRLSLEIPASDC